MLLGTSALFLPDTASLERFQMEAKDRWLGSTCSAISAKDRLFSVSPLVALSDGWRYLLEPKRFKFRE